MTRKETTLCFITYVGNSLGTTMTKALKEFARNEYDATIIDEHMRNDVAAEFRDKADELAAANPKWKRSEIIMADDSWSGRPAATVYWLRVDGETILTIKKAKGKFSGL